MKVIHIIVALALLIGLADAGTLYRPDQINNSLPFSSILMDEDANITLSGGFLKNFQFDGISNPMAYGAVPDDGIEDTQYLQDCLNNSGGILIPPGEYLIDPAKKYDGNTFGGLSVENDSDIFAYGATLKNIEHNLTHYGMLSVVGKNNISIRGITLDGNRSGNSATSGEYGHCINISASSDISIYDVKCRNGWGDGIEIGTSVNDGRHNERINVYRPICEYNRRNAMSILDGIDIKVVEPYLSHSNGTSPEAGLDIEPWLSGQLLQNIKIESPRTKNNTGGGIIICPYELLGHGSEVSVEIDHHRDDAAAEYGYPSLRLFNSMGVLDGAIIINNPVWWNNTGAAFYASAWGRYGPNVYINHPTVINSNHADGTINYLNSAFVVITPETEEDTTQITGGIRIYNAHIENFDGYNPVNSLYVYDYRAAKPVGPVWVDFVDPVKMPNADLCAPFNLTDSYVQKITDGNRLLVYSLPDADTTIGFGNWRPIMNSWQFSTTRTQTLADFPTGAVLEFQVGVAQFLRIDPATGDSIIPTGSGAGKYIQSNQTGASVEMEKINANEWMVRKLVGTWTAE